MSKVWLIVAAAALATLAASRSLQRAARVMDLRDVVNNTVCPIALDWDENPHRQPRRIRLLRCAPEPPGWSAALPAAERCAGGAAPGGRVLQCVELHDKVRVRYGSRRVLYDVAVGCACMLSHANNAVHVPLDASEAYDRLSIQEPWQDFV